jgi:hypothetical protein
VRLRANGADQREPVDARHREIREDEMRSIRVEGMHPFETIAAADRGVAPLL